MNKASLAKKVLRVGLYLFLTLLIITGGVWYWYTHRPLPESIQRTLFEGIVYSRDLRHEPRPIIIHTILADLKTPGIEFLVTPGNPILDQPLKARKTSQFLAEFGVQVAINGDFFTPWYSNNPWDYYPHVGDAVEVKGAAVSRGIQYSANQPGWTTLYLSLGNEASFGSPLGETLNAISGRPLLVMDGKPVQQSLTGFYYGEPQPRTAIALDRTGQQLLLIAVDGRQPNYSEGVTLAELVEIILQYGGYTALNLDGGGSTTLVVEDAAGRPTVLNSPIDNRIPGRERPVANHLGIFARRLY
jgi:hypothetical protein